MALTKIRLGTNEDGTPLYHYSGEHVVLTGPQSSGEVRLADGSTVDVTDAVVEAKSPKHAEAIAKAIAQAFPVTEV